MNVVYRLGVLTFFLCGVGVHASEIDYRQNTELRSAFLGPEQWGEQWLSDVQINEQLKNHFSKVQEILEAQTQQSLSEAVSNIESHYGIQFTRAERSWARQQLAFARMRQIATLDQYASRGRFPVNHGHSSTSIPIFVDDYGTRCAVGYLMHRTGHDKLVESVVQENNYILANDVDGGPFVDWILTSGLTQLEAALIQPAYQPPSFQATLTDFQNPNFSLSFNNYTMSDLSVTSHSYFDPFNDELTFPYGIEMVDEFGTAYDQPDDFGVTFGEGDFESKDMYGYYETTFEEWIFFGHRSGPMGFADPGDNALMYLISYKLDAGTEVFDDFALSSTPLFNFNYTQVPGIFRAETQIYDAGGQFIGSGGFAANSPFDFLEGFSSIPVLGSEIEVRNYVMLYADDPNDAQGIQFTSLWSEFSTSIPEPIGTPVLFVMAIATWVRRKNKG